MMNKKEFIEKISEKIKPWKDKCDFCIGNKFDYPKCLNGKSCKENIIEYLEKELL